MLKYDFSLIIVVKSLKRLTQKGQVTPGLLTAFVFVLYLETPFLSVLPNATFEVPPSPPSQTAGNISLPPGTVTNLNTKNVSQTCAPTTTQNEPLTSMDHWNTTVSIPKLLFMGVPEGSNITHHYAVSSNGTLSASDDSGNSFALKPLAGLPPGLTSVTLKANRTKAFENFLVEAGGRVLANVTVIYSMRHQFCQPAGLKITTEGTVDWGRNGTGTIVVPFKQRPLEVNGSRAWFGNKSGVALGFDWADSLGLNPHYDNRTSTLSYPVRGTFSVDPAVIGTSTSSGAIDFGYQHKELCFGSSRYWLFYYDGTNYGFRSSLDGITWSSETTLATAGVVFTEVASFACSGTTIYYAIPASNNADSRIVYYRYGTLNSDGTIAWSLPESSMNLAYNAYYGSSVTIDSEGDLWMAASSCSPSGTPSCAAGLTFYLEVWECTNPSNCSWSSVGWPIPSDNAGQFWPDILSIGNGQVAVIYATPNINSATGKLAVRAYLGNNAWTGLSQAGEACTSIGCGMYPNYGMGVATIGSTVEIATAALGSPSGNHPDYLTYTTSNGLSAVSSPDGTSNNDCTNGCSISSDGSSNLVFWMASSTAITYMTSSNSGSTWGSKTTLESATITSSRIAAGFGNGHALVAYVNGTASPYDLRFAAFPPISPPITPSPTPPWGEPGLSPYESYVNNGVAYVSLGNGLVSIMQPTFSLPGRGLAVAPTLFYEEPGAFAGTTGSSPFKYDNFTLSSIAPGWSLDLPWLGAYAVHLPGGQQYPYDWNGTDMQVHAPVDFELTSSGGGGACPCVLTLPSGVEYSFNAAKQLISESDPIGVNTITFSYGSNGLLSSITDSVGRHVTFGYDSSNRLASMTAPGGRTWAFSYTGSQLSVTDPVGRTTVFKYASTPGGGWLLGEVNYPTGGGKVTLSYGTAVVYGGTSYVVTLRNVYSAPGGISQSNSISYNFRDGILLNDTITAADGGGHVQGYTTNVFSASTGSQKTYLRDSTGATFRIVESDFTGNRLAATKIEDPYGNVLAQSDIRYDSWGNIIYTKDNMGHETWYSYVTPDSYNSFGNSSCSTPGFYSNSVPSNIHDRLVGACDFQSGPFSQQETFYQYNTLGELTEQKVSHNGGWFYTDYAYSGDGNVFSVKDAKGNYVYYSYSSSYQGAYLTKKSLLANGQNVTAFYTYDFNTGFATSVADPNGQTTGFAYDIVGRLLTTTYPAVNGVSSVVQRFYDDANGIVTAMDPNGNVVKEYFDGIGRETRLERWNGTSVYTTTYYAYNWMDNVASVQLPSGSTYTYAYDSLGRLVSMTNPDGAKRTAIYNDISNSVMSKDEDGHQTYYTYDWDGRLTSVTQYSTSTQPYTTSYIYDGAGNLLSVSNNIAQITFYLYDDLNRLTKVSSPDGNSTSFTYDDVGNLATKTTANGATIVYAYDTAYRLTTVTYPDLSSTSYAYDPSGNIRTVSSTLTGTTAESFTYDNMGRLNGAATTVAGSIYTTNYGYDKASNPVSVTYPDGSLLSMTYDAVNRPKRVGSLATFAYNLDGTIAKVTFGDGEVQSYIYDNRDRVTGITDAIGNKNLLSLSYTYDNSGNVKTIGSSQSRTESFTYDNMSRVASASGGWGTTTYTYDGAGNILATTTGRTTTVYKGCGYYPNPLTGTGVTCKTDKDGNVISKTGGWAYSYNYEDKMIAAKLNGITQQTNIYDGLGNRVAKTEGDTTIFTYQGVNLLFEKDTTTGATTDHVYGNGIQLAKITGGTTYYYHEDQVGSNRLVTYVSSGKVATQFSSDYKPYGASYGASGTEVFQYTDRMLDSATSLYYFNARFYDPSIMKFMTRDPAAGDTAVPASLNLYGYAGGNPLSNIDPTGTLFLTYDPKQLFFSFENQLWALLGLPPCDAACQDIQIERYKIVAPLIGMYTGGEGNVITGGDIFLTKSEAIALARKGGFEGTPGSGATAVGKGQFGGALVRGWLIKTRGIGTFPYESMDIKGDYVRADGSALGFKQEVDILSTNGMIAGEVKTKMTGELRFDRRYEIELDRMVAWRNAGTGRQAFTALVNYYSGPVKIPGGLQSFSASNQVPVVRFIIDWSA